jgi:hypothetical protein
MTVIANLQLTANSEAEKRTHAGQASWATGDNWCFECVFWNGCGRQTSARERACQKYHDLMRLGPNRAGPRVPGTARSCKYFEPREAKL